MKVGKPHYGPNLLAIGRYNPRVLVMAHSHPRLTHGGAEISAYALYNGLRAMRKDETWFLGVSNSPSDRRLGVSIAQPFGDGDFVYTPSGAFEHFKFANRDAELPQALRKLIADLRPDIVHAHHYTQFGVEAFAIIKDARPETKVVLTLHEFLAICHNYGQMVKANSFRLCQRESLADCGKCFPTIAARDFFLRKRYIQKFLNDVDLFIAPSHFLAGRYIAWGLPAAKMRVIENMPPPRVAEASAACSAGRPGAAQATGGAREVRIGFFGQMSPLKGISVLIESARQLKKARVKNLMIDIFGDYSNQPTEFQETVTKALAEAGDNVRYHGPYDNAHVHRLMRTVDAVLVPSIWWENSPVVIQEAYTNGKPVICSDIGGMAEKVRAGLDGIHFEYGKASSLTQVLRDISRRPAILDELRGSLQQPVTTDAAVGAHLAAYFEAQRGKEPEKDLPLAAQLADSKVFIKLARP